jgi:hypothetical protein
LQLELHAVAPVLQPKALHGLFDRLQLPLPLQPIGSDSTPDAHDEPVAHVVVAPG